MKNILNLLLVIMAAMCIVAAEHYPSLNSRQAPGCPPGQEEYNGRCYGSRQGEIGELGQSRHHIGRRSENS